MSYYNTTNLAGAELKQAQADAEHLKDVVYKMFRRHSRLTPWQALGLCEFGTITGVRCAITNLTGAGLLSKTADKVPGPYGRPEHVWEVI